MELLSPDDPNIYEDAELPQGNNDPNDPLRPEVEEEDATGTPPPAMPNQDMDATEEKEELKEASDEDSDVLSEVDEAQFEDFDPNAIAIDDRPIAVDDSNVGLLGVHKRKRDDRDGESRRKKKAGRREKPKKHRRRREDEDVDFEGGEELEGKRVRKRKDGGERRERVRKAATPENEEDLTPEERRRRALDRAMDEALRNPNKRVSKKTGIDLEQMADQEIEDMRRRMAAAAEADSEARRQEKPAMQKLKMLPEVVALLNRNNIQSSIVDPDLNLLESVRFFLEPLEDGSLPAYNIQRDLFAALAKLPITKDALIASGVGKVTWFYTKSDRPEAGIKRQAEKLMQEWTRPILKRSDDYRKRELLEVNYDPTKLTNKSSQQLSQVEAAAQARKRALAAPVLSNRARVEGGPSSYSIVPRSNLSANNQYARPLGASGDDAFRRMKQRHLQKVGGASQRR